MENSDATPAASAAPAADASNLSLEPSPQALSAAALEPPVVVEPASNEVAQPQPLTDAQLAQLTEHMRAQGLLTKPEPTEVKTEPAKRPVESTLTRMARAHLSADDRAPTEAQVARYAEATIQIERWQALVGNPSHANAGEQLAAWQKEMAGVERAVRVDAFMNKKPAADTSPVLGAIERIGATSVESLQPHWPAVAAAVQSGGLSIASAIGDLGLEKLADADAVADRVASFFNALESGIKAASGVAVAAGTPATPPSIPAAPGNPAIGAPPSGGATSTAKTANLNQSEFDAAMAAAQANAVSAKA